jgi:hypothetical protein
VVFRASEPAGYAFLPRPFPIACINVAAYKEPPVEQNSAGQWVFGRKIAQVGACFLCESLLLTSY